ncbi:MAG TPA: hypothetical protein VMV37_01530 [Gammaproteobacteria bacterium]|nr:hypothetical protein [Gammaproteobacteria bacterium]
MKLRALVALAVVLVACTQKQVADATKAGIDVLACIASAPADEPTEATAIRCGVTATPDVTQLISDSKAAKLARAAKK